MAKADELHLVASRKVWITIVIEAQSTKTYKTSDGERPIVRPIKIVDSVFLRH